MEKFCKLVRGVWLGERFGGGGERKRNSVCNLDGTMHMASEDWEVWTLERLNTYW